jgi:hypothetical protein
MRRPSPFRVRVQKAEGKVAGMAKKGRGKKK